MTDLAICAIFRNEARYLHEWVEFHLLQGFSRFYLYQNRSDDDWHRVLYPYTESAIAIVTDWPILAGRRQQMAYDHCLRRLRGQDVAVAFIDCDEFLFSPRYPTVRDALDSLPFLWGALGVNWLCFGSSGYAAYEPGLVTERFTWRPRTSSEFNKHIKSIVRMNQPDVQVTGTPHFFQTSGGTYNEQGGAVTSPWCDHHSDILRINHYSSKSRQEWEERTALGKPDRDNPLDIDPEWYAGRQAKDVDDRDIQRFLPALRQRMENAHAAV